MGTASKTLKDLLRSVDDGELVLPEIQRDFVWPRRSVLMLFDSLYRGLPIGHMLVWKTSAHVATRRFAHKPKGGSRGFYGYLLDGQQRLTAVSRVRDQDDAYPLVFSLWPEDEASPHLDRFSWRTRATLRNPWYVEVAEVLAERFSPTAVIDRLRSNEEFVQREHEDRVRADLSKLAHMLELQLGVTEFESEDYRAATELFIRFNSTGARLQKADLAMAELALAVPRIVSEGMERVASHYSGFPFTRNFLVQALVAVHTGRLNLRNPEEIWGEDDERRLRQSWDRTARGIGLVVEFLTGTVRWDSLAWLPSLNALIPLIFVTAHGKLSVSQRGLARRWLLQAGIHRYFSGSGHAELDRILRKLKDDPTIDRLWASTRSQLPALKAEDFDANHRTGPVMSLFASMIRNRGAKDWERRTALDGSVIGHNAELEVHHFFPRALLARAGIGSDHINTLANYAVICKGTNIGISADEPAMYVAKYKIRDRELADQCIPLDRSLWAVSRYQEFLATRRKLLAKQANDFMNS